MVSCGRAGGREKIIKMNSSITSTSLSTPLNGTVEYDTRRVLLNATELPLGATDDPHNTTTLLITNIITENITQSTTQSQLNTTLLPTTVAGIMTTANGSDIIVPSVENTTDFISNVTRELQGNSIRTSWRV